MATGEVEKWLENAEKGIAQGRPGYVLTSSRELKKLGKPDKAEAILRKALVELPDERFPGEKNKILADLCSIVMDTNPAEVLGLVKMGGKKDPALLLMEATAFGKLDKYDEAIDRLKNEIKLDPDLAKNMFIATKLTTLYLEKGRNQEAVGFLEPLVNAGHFGGHLQIKQILADAYIKTGMADKALELLDDLRDDRSRELIKKAQEVLGGGPSGRKPSVFVVHGHDMVSLSELKNLLYRIGAEPVTFVDLPKPGSPTVIELLEEHVPTFDALVALLTPDDEGRKRGETGWKLRARENVLIEAGYGLISRRERSLIVALGGVSIPTDFEGIHRVPAEKWTPDVGMRVAKRLADMQLNVDTSKAV